MKLVSVILAASVLSACGKDPEAITKAGSNGAFEVHRLFVVDGCAVYRFRDGGNSKYFTNCQGSAFWEQTCGKNCTEQVTVPGGK